MNDIQPVDAGTEAGVAPRDLGDGLVLRWSTAADVDGIAEGAARVFREGPEAPLNEGIRSWMQELGSGRHPYTDDTQGLLVEDTRAGKIVAGMWLIPTRWSYQGVSFGVGRPEAVWSEPEYRRRGLVRAMFEAFHARSAANGDLAQGITGIPFYYRQFGYEFAISLGGGRAINLDTIPALKEGETDPYLLRPASQDDLPFVMSLYHQDHSRALVSSEIDEPYWNFSVERERSNSSQSFRVLVLTQSDGALIGYVLIMNRRWGKSLAVVGFGIAPGHALATVIRPALRALRELAQTIPPHQGTDPASRMVFTIGQDHPLMALLDDSFGATPDRPYSWYVRVPDLPRFMQHIAPVLEQRLVGSIVEGYTGELLLDFYRDGLRLAFDQGRLTAAESWRRPVWSKGTSAGFPPLVFLQVLFGRSSVEDLNPIMHDVWASDEARPLLRVLFPKHRSDLLPLD